MGFAIGLDRVCAIVGKAESAQTQLTYVIQPQDDSALAMSVALGWIKNLRAKSHRVRLATPADQSEAAGQIWVEVSAEGEAHCADARQLVEFNQKLMMERLIES